jgi:antitoxin (DNA-binding transcriptional repressor) of toxin-antitoxin stability system
MFNIIFNMKTITMVELRTDSERVVRELKRGERFELTYRGEKIAELVPPATVANRRTQDVLKRLKERHAGDAGHAKRIERHLADVYEARRAYAGRGSS